MPWWAWVLIIIGVVLLAVVVVPLKLKILKKMMNKDKEGTLDE